MKLSTCASRLALAVLLASFLTACAGEDGNSPATQDVKRVGLMHVGIDHVPPSRDSLTARLKELGWVEGQNIDFAWRNMADEDVAKVQAARFVQQDVDLIVAFEDGSISAAKAATAKKKIPIVFLHPSDPVRDELVGSLSRPGGNLTGVFGARDLVGKQLEFYTLLVPELRRLLTLVDPTDPKSERQLEETQAAAAELGVDLVIKEVSSAADIRRVFRSLQPRDVDGVFILSSKIRLNHTALTIRLAKKARLPVQAHRKEWVEEGALFSYGIDLPLIGRVGARFVDSILKGTKPSKLPVDVVPKIEFALNVETARKLGIRVPQRMIIRADKVYP
jgi:putative ABC transport system substrate-binding protein